MKKQKWDRIFIDKNLNEKVEIWRIGDIIMLIKLVLGEEKIIIVICTFFK